MSGRLTFAWLIVLAFSGCIRSEFSSEKELADFIHDPDNGLEKVEEGGGVKITVTYKPADLMVAQELKSRSGRAPDVSSYYKKYDPYYYFLVSLSNNNREVLNTLNGMETYSDLVETMSFRMNDYVTLTTNASDTIPVADFILNRTFNMSKSTDLLFVFSKEKSEGKQWVQFNLNEFGLNIGNHRFRFLKKDLDSVPCINFNDTPQP